MNCLEIALSLNSNISKYRADELALEIMQLPEINLKNLIHDVATALCHIGQWRESGIGYSQEVSNVISKWIEANFVEQQIFVDELIDLLYELTSKESDEMILRLVHKVENKNLKESLFDALAYKGS